jgi:hypothetical protein
LAQKDIRFARTIQRLQRSIVSELEKIGIIHLFTLGYRGDDLLCFKLGLNNPSKIAELQELEHWKVKFEAAGAATEGYFSKRWVAENMLGVSEDEYLRMQREMYFDKKFAASLEGAAAGGAGGDAGGDAGGGLGGLGLGDEDAGGGDLGDLGDLGGDAGGDTGADAGDAGGDAGGEDETLLAAPAKRDDSVWIRPDAVKSRKRGQYKRHKTSYDKGGRRKQMKNQATGEYGNTFRSRWKGYSDGLSNVSHYPHELRQMGKGIMESHVIEEDKLFNMKDEISVLLEGLKSNKKRKQDEDETQ